ncbi:MAG: hypothetical protein QUS11_10255 [Candidatus Fermentibacter sp.]|nr:hypothetical protein [Candidatus Fermentibacter sp.]
MPKGLRQAASAAAVFASAAVLAWAGLADPLCNWDLAGYTACALELRGTPESSLREETYRSLEGSLPPEAYADMASSTPGRIARATDDASLLQHLPFYRTRPVYTALLAGLTEAGLDPLQASSAISTAAAIATLLLLLQLVPGRRTPGRTAAVAIGSLGAGLVEVARHATPDALASFCAVSVTALLLRGRRAAPAMFPLCVLVRTDLLLFVLPLCAFALARPAFPRVTTVLCAAASTVLAPLLHHLTGGYGWGTTFRYTFLEQAAHPALMSGSVTPADYLAVIRSSLAAIPHAETWVFLFAAVVVIGLSSGTPGRASPRGPEGDARSMLMAAGLSALLHFLVFPAAWLRFFAGQFTMALPLAAFLCLGRARRHGGGERCNP